MSLRNSHSRHCEERSDEAIHISACGAMDCFAALAMTEETSGDNGYFIARGGTPTPALPRKRERGRSDPLVTLSDLRPRAPRALVPLSRLRGRVARASARDGWGLAPHIRYRMNPKVGPSGMTTR
ncbi:hypothetical protein V1273_001756 [Bradyrhizobium sp. AZCC 1721]